MKKRLACLCGWGRVRSKSSETALPLHVADLQAGENRESGSIFQKCLGEQLVAGGQKYNHDGQVHALQGGETRVTHAHSHSLEEEKHYLTCPVLCKEVADQVCDEQCSEKETENKIRKTEASIALYDSMSKLWNRLKNSSNTIMSSEAYVCVDSLSLVGKMLWEFKAKQQATNHTCCWQQVCALKSCRLPQILQIVSTINQQLQQSFVKGSHQFSSI